ncbi:MAG: T9SS type A sorting domain-containing protein [Bacteroidetes bacterium]|nr:T9SS type A sorting domain-containing protein [Bacteroidota bacterium]
MSTAVTNLVMAEVLLDNVEGAVQTMDSVIYREVPDRMRVHYLAKKAELLMKSTGDSSYIATIDSLLYLYPTDNAVLNSKYIVTGDASYTTWYSKRIGQDSRNVIPNTIAITAYPSPASAVQTITITNLKVISNVAIYDYLGRKVDKSRYDYSVAGDNIYFSYNISSGIYLLVITTPDHRYSNKFVINTIGSLSR